VKLRDQKVIPVPKPDFEGSDGLSDDVDVDEEGTEIFLAGVDKDALSR